ncbi:MAG: T9SS type A sorting domain-containing protein, partial [Bacteroidota bacterium]
CRSEQVRNHIQSEFNLPQQVDVNLDVFPANAGKINISTITPNSYPWIGIYFDGVPIKIEAEAMPGYQFSHWEANGLIADTLNAVFLDTLQTDSISFKAHFISTVGINELTSQSIQVYPNPTSDKIIIKHVNSSEILDALNIVDAKGRKYNISFSASGNGEYVVDVSSFSNGYYIINFTSKNGRIFNAPFIKQ